MIGQILHVRAHVVLVHQLDLIVGDALIVEVATDADRQLLRDAVVIRLVAQPFVSDKLLFQVVDVHVDVPYMGNMVYNVVSAALEWGNQMKWMFLAAGVFAISLSASAESPAGRYQIVINPHVRADTFLLDTVTGKVWIRTQYMDITNEPNVWRFEERIDDPHQFIQFIQKYGFKKKALDDANDLGLPHPMRDKP